MSPITIDSPRRGTRRRPLRAPAALLLASLAMVPAGCGAVGVQPTTRSGASKLTSRGRVDSPLTNVKNHLGCLRQHHLDVREISPTELQIGAPSSGAAVLFTPTPGAAQARQIEGRAQGAEVIGSALVYVHQAPASELTPVEDCLAQGVSG